MRKFTKYPQGYVKASITSSSWFRTDDYQICKDLGGGVYDFIEFIGADGQMFSSSGTVNVNDYKNPDGSWNAEALSIIRTYYSDLEELRSSVSNPTDEDQLVAECIFEQNSSYDSDSLTMSEDAAYTYLDDVISGKVMASVGDDIKYYEVMFDTVPRNEEDLDGDVVGEYSICIRGRRRPSLKEATEFCKEDMDIMSKSYGDLFVVNVAEISKEEAHAFFNMDNEDKYPIFE